MQQRGTLTFLFTDIEGSTRLVQQLGDGWQAVLERHRQLLREAFAAVDGEELGTEGDSFFVTFRAASSALAAVIAGQRALAGESWPDGVSVRVRMGLHTGEADFSDGTYIGLDVHRAARISAAGHGGQVLLSDTTRALVEPGLPPEISLRDLGTHRLRDLDAPEHLHQLVVPGLPSEFPALRTAEATPNNLPVQLTSFLGREREIAEISSLLERNRLLTLTGPGGTGKTRLSIEVARRNMARFPDGVFFVSLSPLNEVELVAPTIAHALGLPDRGGRMPEERILDHVSDRHILLVLDNFEQLVPAAPLVNELLGKAANLSALVTSRETLHLYGEQEYAVPPLGVPSLGGRQPAAEAVSQYEAVALFIERAMAVKPGFQITNQNAPAVAELCVRLDGLPLAIELAAARIRILTPDAILRRLGDQLDLLSGGGSDRPERQKTLRGAIAWSYDLLDDRDRQLFAALSTFVGGTTFDAVEEICGPVVDGDVLDGLSSLVEKSLVRQRLTDAGDPRFSMLHTIHEYAVERAVELGMVDGLRERHATFFARLAADARQTIMGSEKRASLDRLELEHDNLRAAVHWMIESGRADLALEATANLWRFWQMRGYLNEGLERVRQALALPATGAQAEAARRSALEAAGGLAYWQGDMPVAEDFYARALEAQRHGGDEQGTADALYNLSFVYAIPSSGQNQMADSEKVHALVADALEIYRRIGDRAGVARSLWSLSNGAWITGDLEAAERYSEEALETFREMDDRFMLGWSLYTLAMIKLQGRTEDLGARLMREALQIFTEAGDISGYVLVLDGLAAEAWVAGDRQRSARLAGAVASLQESSGTGLTPANRELIGFSHDPIVADPSLADAYAEGSRWTPAEAVAYGLEPVAAVPEGS